MSNKIKPIIFVILAVFVMVFAFTACESVQKKYDVSFIVDGEVYKTVQSAGNEVIELPDAPQKENYEFKGWYLDNGKWTQPFDGKNFAKEPIAQNIKVYAHYVYVSAQPEKFDVIFIADGKTVETVQSAGNEVIALPDAPQKENYEFKGWYLDEGKWTQPFDGRNFENEQITSDVKVYAYYVEKEPVQPQEYDVIFIADGKTVDTVKSAGNEVIALPTAPKKENYEFKGWYLDNGKWTQPFDGRNFENEQITSDVKVYAYYVEKEPVQPQKYDVIFIADGKTIETVKSAGNEVIVLPDAPQKDNYEFKGWYLDNGIWNKPFDGHNFENEQITSDVKVYAYYVEKEPVEPEKFDIIFMADGQVVNTVQSAGNEVIVLPEAPHKDNYEFKGWYLDQNVWKQPFDGHNFADEQITHKVYVYAYYVYVAPTYTVSFNTDGGTELEPVIVSVIDKAPFTEKPGFEIEGWYEDAEKTVRVSFPYSPEKDITLYVKWKEKSVTFTLDEYNNIKGVSNIPADGKLVIPAYVNGVKVSGLANYAFKRNKDIVEVEIDESITSLGIETFRDCVNLKYVKLSDKTRILSPGLFRGCSSLKSIELPNSLKEIRSDVFTGCGLINVVIPDSVEEIWQFVFKDCTNLLSVDLGKVTDLSMGIFNNCSKLTSITFPETLQEIDSVAFFSGCSQLKDISYPDLPIPLSSSFLDGTAYFKDESNWQDGVLYLGKHMITVNNEYSDRTSFAVKEGTITIARSAFSNAGYAPKLQSVTLPEGLQVIGQSAFAYCDQLRNVSIPDSVQRICSDAFPSQAIDSEGYIGNWLLKPNFSGTTITVREGTVGIGDGKITNKQYEITSIQLPSSLKHIGESNFDGMSALKEINIPEGLESIGAYAFRACEVVEGIDLSKCSSLQSIGYTAFSFCKKLTEMYVPYSVTRMGSSVFNQIPGIVVNIERKQSEVPAGWSSSWDSTYANVPLQINWGVNHQ